MKTIVKNYTHHVLDSVNVDLQSVQNYNLHVVYFINGLVNNNYIDWLRNQLLLVQYNCPIYVVACIYSSDENNFRESIKKLFPSWNIHIECYYTNEHEYRGILKVWELGQIHNATNDIILYFHSKGITHSHNYDVHKNDNYNIILKDIDKIKEIFTIFPTIDKVGYSSSHVGWIWYNFWFVRGSYVYMVEKPIKTERRHYYEDWLCRKVDESDKTPDNERSISYYKNTL